MEGGREGGTRGKGERKTYHGARSCLVTGRRNDPV